LWPRTRDVLRRSGLAFDEAVTRAPHQAEALAKAAGEQGYTTILYVGGDGTASEVANGLMQIPEGRRPALAALPRGTGGDFPKGLGMDGGVQAAIVRLERKKERRIDVACATFTGLDGRPASQHYLNIGDAGIGGGVSERVNRTSKLFGGLASFLWATLACLLTYQNRQLTVTVDGRSFYEGPAVAAVAANGPRFGGGMLVAPRALQDDGVFDVVVIGDVSKPELLHSLPRLYRGTHLSHPSVTMVRGREVIIEGPEPVPLEIDGEYPGSSPFHARIEPRALRVLV
jgi:YegS/Rv2252/BmrU family lipid kinase